MESPRIVGGFLLARLCRCRTPARASRPSHPRSISRQPTHFLPAAPWNPASLPSCPSGAKQPRGFSTCPATRTRQPLPSKSPVPADPERGSRNLSASLGLTVRTPSESPPQSSCEPAPRRAASRSTRSPAVATSDSATHPGSSAAPWDRSAPADPRLRG